MKKQFLSKLILLSMIVSIINSPVGANAEWKKDSNGWWNTEGNSWSTGWRQIDNKWYYFNPQTGYMKTGWINDNGTWYYSDASGAMKTGWINDNGTWYYSDSSGAMKTGWINDNSTWYYSDASGAMKTGWINDNGKWYFTSESGAMQTGVVNIDNQVYCLSSNGEMLTGNVTIEGKVYTFDESGKNIDVNPPSVNKTFVKDESGVIKEQDKSASSNKDENSIVKEDNSSKDTSSEKDNNSSTSHKNSSSSSNNANITIDKIETVKNGVIKVYLNKATTTALTKDDFYITCKIDNDMTIISVENSTGENKNKVYTLNTSYYRDNTYTLHVKLPSGKTIEKDFESREDCPIITQQSIKRTSNESAEFYYVSDAEGTLHYILQEDSKVRSLNLSNSIPTEEEIISSGNKEKMKVNENTIKIDGLEENKSYKIYYVAEDVDGKATTVKSENIDFYIPSDNVTSDYSIENAKAYNYIDKNDIFESKYWITFELNKATENPITIDDISLSCPQGPASVGKIETIDNKTYNLYFKEGTIPFSNNTYSLKVNINGNTIEKGVYIDLDAPLINIENISRTTSSAVEIELKAGESGKIYYSILDNVEQDTSAKDPTDIYDHGYQKEISYGTNYITIEDDSIETGKYIGIASEDENGNRMQYFIYKQIPEYIENDDNNEDVEEKLKITDIEYGVEQGWMFNEPYVIVTFNKDVDSYSIDNSLTEITNLSGGKGMYTLTDPASNKVKISITNGLKMNAGEHRIILYIGDEKITYDFTTDTVLG